MNLVGNHNDGETGSVRVSPVTRDDEMPAYDDLPARVRKALAEAPYSIDAKGVYDAKHRIGLTEDQLVEGLKRHCEGVTERFRAEGIIP